MRTIIAGSRDCTDPKVLRRALSQCGWAPCAVLSGTARGADTLGEQWAQQFRVPLEYYPADWNTHGRGMAGKIRNQAMADAADALVALWDGNSGGTADMIRRARAAGLKVFVYKYEDVKL